MTLRPVVAVPPSTTWWPVMSGDHDLLWAAKVDAVEDSDGWIWGPRWAVALVNMTGLPWTERLHLIGVLRADPQLAQDFETSVLCGTNASHFRAGTHSLDALHAWLAQRD